MHFDGKRTRWIAVHVHVQFVQTRLKYIDCETSMYWIRWNVSFKFVLSVQATHFVTRLAVCDRSAVFRFS